MWMGMIRAHGLVGTKIDDVIGRFGREDLPTIAEVPGFVGVAIGANYTGGSCVSLSFWEDQAALARADEPYNVAQERARQDFGPEDPYLVNAYEVVFSEAPGLVLDAARPHVRLVRFTGIDSSSMDQAVETLVADSEQQLESARGLGGVAIGCDRAGGSLIAVSYWQSERDMNVAAQGAARAGERVGAATNLVLTPLIDHFAIALTRDLERVVAVVQHA